MNKVLVQSLSISSKTGLNIYYKNLNIRIISIVSERLKSEDISKEGNIKKIPKLHGDTAKPPAPAPKSPLALSNRATFYNPSQNTLHRLQSPTKYCISSCNIEEVICT